MALLVPHAGGRLGQIECKEKSAAECELVEWHHRLNRHELGQTPGDGEEQGGLVCCGPCGRKKSDTTEQLNNNDAGDVAVWQRYSKWD